MRNTISPPTRGGRRFRLIELCRCGCGKVVSTSNRANAASVSLASFGLRLSGRPTLVVISSRSMESALKAPCNVNELGFAICAEGDPLYLCNRARAPGVN